MNDADLPGRRSGPKVGLSAAPERTMNGDPILIIAPHPDDETLGCGGTFARRIQAGNRVHVAVLTDGTNLFRLGPLKIGRDPTPAETGAMRRAETLRSVRILGGRTDDVVFMGFEDGSLSGCVEAVAERLAEWIGKIRPGEIWVTSEYEEHPDHVAACVAARRACERSGSRARLLRYITILRTGLSPAGIDEPRIVEDITGQLELKREAVGGFDSHLKVVARGQTAPLFANMDRWLSGTEVFFVERAAVRP